MSDTPIDPLQLVRPRRKVHGTTAVLLPFTDAGQIDWRAFDALLDRTVAAGLTPAVNMDTGYVNLLDEPTQDEVLRRTGERLAGGRFVAGAFVKDSPGDPFNLDAYARRIDAIQQAGAAPVIFQSYGLAHRGEAEALAAYQVIAERCDEFIGFELGAMFAPFGKIYSLETYRGLIEIPQCSGAKHSSLRRDLEWRRVALRNEVRPDFRVYTGNDLAIDMVIYGSDYLLGLSCFAPDAFARRDAMWEAGDSGWHELNDLLQHLGFLAFHQPVPAYKHAAAMFLKARGWLDSSATHPDSPRRGAADEELLIQIAATLEERLASS